MFELLIQPTHDRRGSLIGPLWMAKRETENRLRGRIETIIAKNADLNDPLPNPAALTKVLREKLPKRPKRDVQHHPALPYEEMPTFMIALSGAAGRAATMLRFLILTACRTTRSWKPAGMRSIAPRRHGRSRARA